MAQEPIIWREPESFTIGDTLLFQRYLPSWLPSDGWSIQYVVSSETAGKPPALNFVTTPDSTNKIHTVAINNFAFGVEPGVYILSGFLVNGAERHQIYYSELSLRPNLPSTSTIPLKSFEQEMVELMRNKVRELESQILQETDVQRTRFVVEERDKALKRLNFWEERMAHVVKSRIAKNTGFSQNLIQPLYAGGW